MAEVTRGRLLPAASAPASGERVAPVFSSRGVVVEQILSGRLDAPVDFLQGHDEWVVVLEGGAHIEVHDETIELGAGDWVLIPADAPHRVMKTQRGTSWLAVHLPRPPV
jgi:cupin 2 domain-containing protein